jgi:caa(3)-type oxidase subunit IV
MRVQNVAWFGPTLAWIVLLCATAAVTWLGLEASGRLRFGGALAIAALMLGTLAFGLVGVGRNPALLRLIAGAAFLFLALMFVLSFVDLMTRLR